MPLGALRRHAQIGSDGVTTRPNSHLGLGGTSAWCRINGADLSFPRGGSLTQAMGADRFHGNRGGVCPRSNLAADTASGGERGGRGELPFGGGLAVELPYKPWRSHLGTCFAIAPTVWVTVISPPPPACTSSHWLNLQGFLHLGLWRAISDWLNQHSGRTGS